MTDHTVVIEGLDELLATIERLRIPADEVEPILYEGARELQARIRAAAPLGPTGNLRKGIVAKRLSRGGYLRSIFTATEFHKAPHDHLVEFGAVERRPKKRTVMFDKRTGKFYGRRVAPMPARPFFWPTVAREMPAIEERMAERLQKLVEQRIR